MSGDAADAARVQSEHVKSAFEMVRDASPERMLSISWFEQAPFRPALGLHPLRFSAFAFHAMNDSATIAQATAIGPWSGHVPIVGAVPRITHVDDEVLQRRDVSTFTCADLLGLRACFIIALYNLSVLVMSAINIELRSAKGMSRIFIPETWCYVENARLLNSLWQFASGVNEDLFRIERRRVGSSEPTLAFGSLQIFIRSKQWPDFIAASFKWFVNHFELTRAVTVMHAQDRVRRCRARRREREEASTTLTTEDTRAAPPSTSATSPDVASPTSSPLWYPLPLPDVSVPAFSVEVAQCVDSSQEGVLESAGTSWDDIQREFPNVLAMWRANYHTASHNAGVSSQLLLNEHPTGDALRVLKDVLGTFAKLLSYHDRRIPPLAQLRDRYKTLTNVDIRYNMLPIGF